MDWKSGKREKDRLEEWEEGKGDWKSGKRDWKSGKREKGIGRVGRG